MDVTAVTAWNIVTTVGHFSCSAVALSLKTSLMRLDSVKSFLQINHLDVIIYLEALLLQPTAPGSGLVFQPGLLLSVQTLIRINESSVLFFLPSVCFNWSYKIEIFITFIFFIVISFCSTLTHSWFYPICWTPHYISGPASSGQFCHTDPS